MLSVDTKRLRFTVEYSISKIDDVDFDVDDKDVVGDTPPFC